MSQVLQSVLYKFCHVYMDDIIIHSKTLEEHVAHVNEVLSLIRKAGLKINWKKSHFLKQYVDYLGFTVGQGQIKVAKSKIAAIENYPPPDSIKKIKSFLGLCSWFKRFVLNFASIAEPLTQLLRKDIKFVWGVEQQRTFDLIKSKLINAVTL